MTNKFQLLVNKILENNAAGVGGVFGSTSAYGNSVFSSDPANLDTKTSMAITGKPSKNKKKKKFPLIRRPRQTPL